MLGVICFRTGRLRRSHELIRRVLDRTEWRIPVIRDNFALVLSTMLRTNETIEALLADDAGVRARIAADSRRRGGHSNA